MENQIMAYMNRLNTLNDKDYMFEMIGYNLAPTLFKEKCSTLLNFYNKKQYSFWEENKSEIIYKYKLKSFEIASSDYSTIVLFYDEKLIMDCLKNINCVKFLEAFGYEENFAIEDYLDLLKSRYITEFPHEIGLFLGFPLWDVVEYIKNKGKNYIYCGYWKVYSNLNFALNTFEKYNNAKLKVVNNRCLYRCSRKQLGVL